MQERELTPAYREVVERLWTQPVFQMAESCLPEPLATNVLVAESRCGYVPLHLASHLPEAHRIMALDPSGDMLDEARGRTNGTPLQRRIFYVQQRVGALSYADGVFGASLCFHGMVTARQVREGISELTRVTVPGGGVVACVPLAESFPEFYDLMDEALRASQLHGILPRVAELRDHLTSAPRLYEAAVQAGLEDITLTESQWDLSFASGRDFLLSPLVQETFLAHWSGLVRAQDRPTVLRHIDRAITSYWSGQSFATPLVAACLRGTKPASAA